MARVGDVRCQASFPSCRFISSRLQPQSVLSASFAQRALGLLFAIDTKIRERRRDAEAEAFTTGGTPVYIVESERLGFRHLLPEDLDALYALYRDPEIRRYFPDGTRTYEQTRDELDYFVRGVPAHPELGLWATIHKPTGAFIGRCGLLPWTIGQKEEVEVAFLLAKPYWGQGLGTEAAGAIAGHAFERLRLERLICLITPGNEASVGVAGRIGMRFEEEIVDEFGPALVYALSRPASRSG